jgi:hypothetical protein
MENTVPGGVYLCQVSETVSCGACCGLYNVADPSRAAMTAMLERRTDAFSGVARTVAGILAFKASVEARENQARPYPDFHHCPYIGLIGRRRSRVGCLLHPMADGNGGVDFRGISFYGGMACRIYFCPATKTLPPRWKEALRAAAPDWYHYGLLVTEKGLIQAFFQALEARLGREITATDFGPDPASIRALSDLFALKAEWPHRPPGASTPCNYFFEDNLYPTAPVVYPDGRGPSACHDLFVALNSHFPSADALETAETALSALLGRLVHALTGSGRFFPHRTGAPTGRRHKLF